MNKFLMYQKPFNNNYIPRFYRLNKFKPLKKINIDNNKSITSILTRLINNIFRYCL